MLFEILFAREEYPVGVFYVFAAAALIPPERQIAVFMVNPRYAGLKPRRNVDVKVPD